MGDFHEKTAIYMVAGDLDPDQPAVYFAMAQVAIASLRKVAGWRGDIMLFRPARLSGNIPDAWGVTEADYAPRKTLAGNLGARIAPEVADRAIEFAGGRHLLWLDCDVVAQRPIEGLIDPIEKWGADIAYARGIVRLRGGRAWHTEFMPPGVDLNQWAVNSGTWLMRGTEASRLIARWREIYRGPLTWGRRNPGCEQAAFNRLCLADGVESRPWPREAAQYPAMRRGQHYFGQWRRATLLHFCGLNRREATFRLQAGTYAGLMLRAGLSGDLGRLAETLSGL